MKMTNSSCISRENLLLVKGVVLYLHKPQRNTGNLQNVEHQLHQYLTAISNIVTGVISIANGKYDVGKILIDRYINHYINI
jgi:hypothetical protein